MSPAYRGTALVAVGFLLGGLVASVAVGFHYRQTFELESERWLFVASQGGVISDVNVLTSLRAGDTDYALVQLEEELSSELWYLAITFPKESLSDKACLRILGIAARYRSKHPYRTGEDQRDRLVEELLTKVRNGNPGQVPASAAEEKTPTRK